MRIITHDDGRCLTLRLVGELDHAAAQTVMPGIEDAVEEYREALIFVSHDRYFIQEFATRIWAIEDGHIIDFDGGFNAYKEYRARQQSLEQTAKTVEKKKEKQPRKKNSGSREKQLGKLERDIAKAEAAIADLEHLIEENATDYARLMELSDEKQRAEADLETLYSRWEELAEE